MKASVSDKRRRPLSRRKRIAFAVLAASMSTIVALLVGEFVARWAVEGSFLEAVDSITGLRTAEDPGAGPAMLVEDPVLGFRLNPELDDVNSLGLRHGEIPAVKQPGEFRCFLLGDSVAFTMGSFFRELRDFVQENAPGPSLVINAAVYGYTTYQERRFLERDLLPLQPDLVVVQYCVNDNHRFLHRLTSKGRRLMTLAAKSYLFPKSGGLVSWLSRHSYLVYCLRRLALSLQSEQDSQVPWNDPISASAWDDATWREQEEHFRAMADGLRRVGGRLAVLAVPCERQLDPKLLEHQREFALRPQIRLGEICRKLQVPYLDLHADFLRQRQQDLFTDGLHLTDAGHRLVGSRLVEFLAGQGLVGR